MISVNDYLMRRGPVDDEFIENAEDLLEKISLLEEALGVEFVLTGGYRPEEEVENHTLPGCPHDAHTTCRGIDLHDPTLAISAQLMNDQDLLVQTGLWMENPISAKDHIHLQSYPPGSGKRVFFA